MDSALRMMSGRLFQAVGPTMRRLKVRLQLSEEQTCNSVNGMLNRVHN